jgi:hypothetical protein
MSKFGLIAAIMGFGILTADLLLRLLANLHTWTWLWMPGAALLAAGSALFLWTRARPASALPMPRPKSTVGTDTARLLDNFEQRFAELKGRKPNATVLGDLYTLGGQLEQRGRVPQATAVYRHLARFDNTYKDVAARLRRLMDSDRGKPKAATADPAAAEGSMSATTPDLRAPSERPPAAVPEAERLGRYQLEREIGRGAMGIVYLGRDTAINRMVAIKAIPLASEFSDSELVEARSRFFREAETAGRLNHPNIVTIYDVGEERGLAYIAMEYLKGRHLSEYAKSNNLLEPRIVLGTPSFMSPEQLEGRTVTGHSDLFSLGVSLFQLLTGQLPFTADSMTGLMQQIAEAPHPPLRAFRPDLPACVESVIDRALAKNPEARYDSGAQMAAALDDCRSKMPSGSP